MPLSTAPTLQTVADAYRLVADNVTNLGREHSHVLKKVTLPGGKASFRFTTTVTINGEQVEVQVRTK